MTEHGLHSWGLSVDKETKNASFTDQPKYYSNSKPSSSVSFAYIWYFKRQVNGVWHCKLIAIMGRECRKIIMVVIDLFVFSGKI